MTLPTPEPGMVLRYAFLWSDEAKSGREEALKDRPAVIVFAVRRSSERTIVLVAPVTHREPTPTEGIEIPSKVKAHLRLDHERSWIIPRELNEFVWPGPDLRPTGESGPVDYGFLPPRLFNKVRGAILTLSAAGELRRTPRT